MKKNRILKNALTGMVALGVLISPAATDSVHVSAESKVSPITDYLTEGKYDASTESLSDYQVPEWYRDAKFGIFIHYGIYSVPAFGDEWYGHWMYMNGTKSYGGSDIFTYHKNTYGGAAAHGYKDFIPQFAEDLKSYSQNDMAGQWAELFSNAGAKYVMPVGMHHDSFALYNSGIQTTYSSVAQAGVDYIDELQKACKDKGMHFGISNHFAENDWFFDDNSAKGTDMSEKNDDGSLKYGELYGDGKSKSSDHIHKWYNISMEIIDKYKPDLIYYDFDLVNDNFNKYDDANRYLMLANYYNQAAINNPDGVGCFYKAGAYTTAEALSESERSASSDINPNVWQTCTSIGRKSWGYTTDEVYRTGEEFIGGLVDIVSKNGNLLLNVGPMADGTIPDNAANALLTVGKWLSTYGDAIYATRPWYVYGEGPTKNAGDNYSYKYGDIRFTQSKDNSSLYVTALAKPQIDTMSITTLGGSSWDATQLKSVSLINGTERTELDWEQTDEALNVSLPDYKSIDGAYAVELKFNNNIITPLIVDGTKAVDAAKAYTKYGMTSGNCSDEGSDTLNTQTKGYAAFQVSHGSDFTPTSYNVRVSSDSEGTIEVRENGYDGKLIGKTSVDWDSERGYRDITDYLYLDKSDDPSDIYLIFKGSFKMTSFNLADESSVPGYKAPTDKLVDDSEPFFTPEPQVTPAPVSTKIPDSSTNVPSDAPAAPTAAVNIIGTAPSASPVNSTVADKSRPSFTRKKLTLGIGEKMILPLSKSSPKITAMKYTTKSTKIAIVSSKGVVTAKKCGRTTITAASSAGSASITVIVKRAPKRIITTKSSYNLKKGKSIRLKYSLPAGTSCSSYSFTSSRKSIISVSKTGMVKAVKRGTAQITIKTYNKKSAVIKIVVK